MSSPAQNHSDNTYKSEDDEEYNPDFILQSKQKDINNSSDESALSDDFEDNFVSPIQSSVKTRKQRITELEDEKKQKNLNKFGYILENNSNASTNFKIDDIFQKLNSITNKIYKKNSLDTKIDILNNISETNLENILVRTNGDSTYKKPEMINIKRTYKFAGRIVTEDMSVPKESAMGQEYLHNLKFDDKKSQLKQETSVPSETMPKSPKQGHDNGLRKPLKRNSILIDIINGNNSKYAKISTLDKSKMDWANYVDSQRDMKESLETGWKGQKGGYLERKKFLEGKDVTGS
ncbi:hypothetical protein QEN19_000501 [Hanseniaspora menglaensis]